MEIKVLGTGCQKCKSLYKVVSEVVEENSINAQVDKIEDIVEIMNYNILSTPAMVIDGKVVLKGKVPSKEEILKIINNENSR
ncbi:MAG: thioredoxin family protein [Bacteroidales bacterium]